MINRVLLYTQDLKHDKDMKHGVEGPAYEEFMCLLGPYA